MSKTKKSNEGRYEILYIVSNKFSEEEVKGIDTKIEKIITDNKAKITKKTSLGKKKLAYKIQKFDYGYYNLMIFETERENVNNIDRLVRQMREILRYCIVVNVDEEKFAAKTAEEPEQDKKKKGARKSFSKKPSSAPFAAKSAPAAAKTTTDKEEVKQAVPESSDTKEKEDKPTKEVVSDKKTDDKKDNLDDKLDDILEAKNLF